jgi:hypothetical protein
VSKGAPSFEISIPPDRLENLRSRLAGTRWPTDIDPVDRYYGTDLTYMSELVTHWLNCFDWAAAEAELNTFAHYRAVVDGVPIHFIRERGVGPAPIPLILSHGWPWSFWDWRKVIRPLADPASYGADPGDAFDVVVPSLPGFAFSAPTGRTDLNFWKIADLLHVLMTRVLGFDRYAAGGCDYGALVSGQLGHKYADRLYGLWLGDALRLDLWQRSAPWAPSGRPAPPDGAAHRSRGAASSRADRYTSHIAVHMLDPQNISYALADSPVGMLSWLLRRWTEWSDCDGDVETVFPRSHLLTNATVWWATETITSSIRVYSNTLRYQWTPSHQRRPTIEAPAGITFLGGENSPGISTAERVQAFQDSPGREDWFNCAFLNAHERGGHFAPWENPAAVIHDIRATFRGLR